jgi:hypothetical protein
MKQTSTEFLFEKLWNTDKDKLTWYAILQQAKEIEKEQSHAEYMRGWKDGLTKHEPK